MSIVEQRLPTQTSGRTGVLPDYGPRARVGIAVPQANPTVEPEIRAALPDSIGVYATRLVHPSPKVEERIAHYIRHMPEAIATFGTLDIRAFGFGCTGSSYLVGHETEDRLTREAQEGCGIPVITAAQAIRQTLRELGVSAFALVSPYTESLSAAGYRYWETAGFRITSKLRVDNTLANTHAIYELGSADALEAVSRLDTAGADCVVISGTGMPTLRALQQLAGELAVPVVSSNLCLAWVLCREIAPELAPPTPAGLMQVR